MELKFNVKFMDCQQCHTKINCAKCDERIGKALEKNPEIERAQLNLLANQAVIMTDLDLDDAADYLEDEGLLVM